MRAHGIVQSFALFHPSRFRAGPPTGRKRASCPPAGGACGKIGSSRSAELLRVRPDRCKPSDRAGGPRGAGFGGVHTAVRWPGAWRRGQGRRAACAGVVGELRPRSSSGCFPQCCIEGARPRVVGAWLESPELHASIPAMLSRRDLDGAPGPPQAPPQNSVEPGPSRLHATVRPLPAVTGLKARGARRQVVPCSRRSSCR